MIDQIRAGKFEIGILYEDNHLLVVEKPANLPVQADSSGDDDLLSILKRYIGNKYQKPGNVYMGLVHRLDRPVGGVMVFARTSKAAARLSAAFASHEQERRYWAVVQGRMDNVRILEDYLVKNGATGMVRVVSPGHAGRKVCKAQDGAASISEPFDADRSRTVYRTRPSNSGAACACWISPVGRRALWWRQSRPANRIVGGRPGI